MGIEQFDQLGKIGERSGQAVDLVTTMTSILRVRTSSRSRCRLGRSVVAAE
jgi:hypothetical protein